MTLHKCPYITKTKIWIYDVFVNYKIGMKSDHFAYRG